MAYYLDTSAPGGSPLTGSGQVYNFSAETPFYISVASNLIAGQTTGPSVTFTIYSKKGGKTTFNVDYGTTNTAYAVPQTGYMIEATVPTGAGSVSCRVVIDRVPTPLTIQNVAATVTSGTVGINGTVATDVGQGTAPSPGVVPLTGPPTPATIYGASPIAFLAQTSKAGNNVTTLTLSALTTVANGDIIVFIQSYSAAGYRTVSSVTDGNSNSYALVSGGRSQSQQGLGTYWDCEVWLAGFISGASNTVTVNLSGLANVSVLVVSMSGSPSLDSVGTYAVLNSGTFSGTVSDTVVAESGVMFIFGGIGGAASFTPGGGMTVLQGTASNSGLVSVAYQTVGSGNQSRGLTLGSGALGGQFLALAFTGTPVAAQVNSNGQLEVYMVNGVLTLTNNDGTIGLSASSGNVTISVGSNFNKPQVYAPSTPGAVAATKMLGLGAATGGPQFTPLTTGTVVVRFNGFASCPSGFVAGNGASWALRYGLVSGGVPVNGGATAGTQAGATTPTVYPGYPGSVMAPASFPIVARITGLSVGSAYWFDIELVALAGSNDFTVNTPVFEVTETE